MWNCIWQKANCFRLNRKWKNLNTKFGFEHVPCLVRSEEGNFIEMSNQLERKNQTNEERTIFKLRGTCFPGSVCNLLSVRVVRCALDVVVWNTHRSHMFIEPNKHFYFRQANLWVSFESERASASAHCHDKLCPNQLRFGRKMWSGHGQFYLWLTHKKASKQTRMLKGFCAVGP